MDRDGAAPQELTTASEVLATRSIRKGDELTRRTDQTAPQKSELREGELAGACLAALPHVDLLALRVLGTVDERTGPLQGARRARDELREALEGQVVEAGPAA